MDSPGTTGKFIGARVRRVEDPRVLLGRATFVDDVRLPNTLAVAFVRSPYAHARIISIDLEAARKSPGVHSVLASAGAEQIVPTLRMRHDAGFPAPPCRSVEWPVLASGKVRFVGEAVVVVVAENRALAEDAAATVEIDWDPLDPVVDPERGCEPGAPLVHEEWPDNIFQTVEFSGGEVAEAFSRAKLVVSERFRTGRHMALPMEAAELSPPSSPL